MIPETLNTFLDVLLSIHIKKKCLWLGDLPTTQCVLSYILLFIIGNLFMNILRTVTPLPHYTEALTEEHPNFQ
jgi:hypothetical protein